MQKKKKLDNLKKKMEADNSLPLKKGSTKLVFGVGDSNSKVLFIGEGPGYYEDQSGIPFVGRAGKFLDELLHSIKLPREKVYITNVIHHRPLNNRDPLPEEINAYGKYLDKIIEIVEPSVIVTLGRFSMGKFLPGVYISQVNGKVYEVSFKEKTLYVVPMYHPAAGLRNGSVKRATMEDFLVIPKVVKKIKVKKQKKEPSKQMGLGVAS